MNKKSNINNLCIILSIAGNLNMSRTTHINKRINLLEKIYSRIILIVENNLEMINNNIDKNNILDIYFLSQSNYDKYSENKVFKLLCTLYYDLKRIKLVIRNNPSNTSIMFIGIYQPIAIIVSKVLRYKTIIFGGGFDIIPNHKESFIHSCYRYLKWCYQVFIITIVDNVLVESPYVLKFYNLEKYLWKSFTNAHLYVDLNKFKKFNDLINREIDIGFIGALSPEKGFNIFLEIISELYKNISLKTIIIGDGKLKNNLSVFIKKYNQNNHIRHVNWINHKDMPNQLNKIKILLAPSYSEGLSSIILEAMACGTLVMATNVGGTQSVINNDSGFILKDVKIYEICSKLLYVLNNIEKYETMSENAQKIIKKEYSYEISEYRWSKIFEKILENS